MVPFSRGTAAGRMLLVFSTCSSCRTTVLLWVLGEGSGSTLQLSWSRMAWTMGTIMAVVAVLLIHMDRKAVTPMKPSINLRDTRGGDHQQDELVS